MEKKLQKRIILYLEKMGCYVIKTIVTNKKGTPDLIVCVPGGYFLAIEVKDSKNKSSVLQQKKLEKIRDIEGKAFTTSSMKEFKEKFHAFEEFHPL